MAKVSVRRVGVGLLAIAIAAVATLAIPDPTWRTGRTPLPPLSLVPSDALPAVPRRVWIDTDAACGHTPRTDVDDCLAVWILATASDLTIAGVSSVFGNAPLDVTDRTTRTLVDRLALSPPDSITVYRGAAAPIGSRESRPTAARDGLIHALERGPLTIVALGPLTNIADALAARPDLAPGVGRLVAVMGRRPGHLFHPTEAAPGAGLLGHGPIFRDFNFSADPQAVRALVARGRPLTLVPYDAARSVEITPADLDRLARQGDAGAWIAERSRDWVDYWRTEIGRSGFYPFDALAAAYVRDPGGFRCASVDAWVGNDSMLGLPFLRPEALLVSQRPSSTGVGRTFYCPEVQEGFDEALPTAASRGRSRPRAEQAR